MKIKYLKEDAVDLLKKQDIERNAKYYKGDNSWIVTKYSNKELFGCFNKVEFNDFELVYTNGNDDDFENMKIMYENLKDLTDSQASDERIWSGLAHHYFWNSTKAPFLNGLSRLWWYARYTYNENLEDPYELTKYICEMCRYLGSFHAIAKKCKKKRLSY